jgi:hypothetical protein
MQSQTSMFDAPASVATYADAVGCAFNHRGSEGVIVAYDTVTYAEPMYIVRFASGRTGVLRPTELGAS